MIEYIQIIVQTVLLLTAIAGVYSKLKSDVEVLRNDIKWIKKALFHEEEK